MMTATLEVPAQRFDTEPVVDNALLSMKLSVDYPEKAGVLHNLSLEVRRGEILGLVGQSGCGKSTLALAILKLIHLKNARAAGYLRFDNRDLMACTQKEMRAVRGRQIALVLQSPMSALNPALRLDAQLGETWKAHQNTSRPVRNAAIAEALASVSLPYEAAFLHRYPAQLSVGQAQRLLIAMAVLHRPPLLIADEPTSALDIITQAEILQLFLTLSKQLGMSILYISHDLPSVATISDRVAVMESGQIVECRRTADLFTNPQSEYTKKLVAALLPDPRISQLRRY